MSIFIQKKIPTEKSGDRGETRYMAWLGLRNNNLQGTQMRIVTGPRTRKDESREFHWGESFVHVKT
jgi:hypothetical protein